MGSKYSDDTFNTHDRRFIDSHIDIERDRQMRDSQIDIDRQLRDSLIDIDRDRQLRDNQRHIERGTQTGSEKFVMLLDRLMADINLEKTDTDLRTKSLPDRDKDERRKETEQSVIQRSQSELDTQQVKDTVPRTVDGSRKGDRNPLDQD